MSMPEPTTAPVAESSRRHSHRSKATTSVRDLTALILKEQSDHRETQRELLRVNELLHLANMRADAAEKNVTLAIERLKNVNEERLAAVREAARANESLELYKFQLETAQHEIHRAQSVFNIVERERYQAEVAGAKSRTAARRLNEEHKIYLAREEGRRAGMKEGFQAGRLGIWADGGGTPAPSNFGDTQLYDYYTDDFDNEPLESPNGSITPEEELDSGPSSSPSPNPPSIAPPRSTVPPSQQRPPSIAAPTQSHGTPAPLPIPPPVPAATAPLSPLFTPFHDIHPISVHNEAPHPRHEHVAVPPEGYIPTTGPDGLVHIPPAHEFSFQPESTAPRSNASVGEESVIAPSTYTYTKAMSLRQHARSPGQRTNGAPSIIAESVRRAPSAAGSIRPVQMPTPRMNTNLAGIEHQAQQRSSFSSDFYGGGGPAQPPLPSDESDPIPINIQSPSRRSYTSSAQIGSPSMGNKLFGPSIADPSGNSRPLSRPSTNIPGSPSATLPLGFQRASPSVRGTSPMPGAYMAPSEAGAPDSVVSYVPEDLDLESLSTQTSMDTLTTPPPGKQRRQPRTAASQGSRAAQ
ncbi:hypothetical protein MSAN_00006300 [Mycena sanguinolenta]|uniref:Uncharacterized protein n=1 Tax=Mycena sanguinolenta TaxID=230812 RepID=A0A8H6ZEL8_9AGAR|nr:hypothetical protein MSAN_00006300 [Mycena sanguinolenta]